MKELIDFWKYGSELKRQKRRGWVQKLKLSESESVADHSFGLMILSLYEARRRGYDVEKVLSMALIHDLEEAITGDMTPSDKNRKGQRSIAREKRAARRRILESLPKEFEEDLGRLWAELTLGRTKEARLVKDLDKTEMALQADEYRRNGADARRIQEFYRSATRGITDHRLRVLVQRLGRSD